MESNLATIVEQLGNPKILVLGDLILDRYIWGNADRVSPEAPVLVLCADDEEVRLGGAASVAMLLHTLKAQVILTGVIGDDSASRMMRAILTEADLDHDSVLSEPGRVTTTKDRFIGRAANRHPNQILRVDREMRDPIQPALQTKLIETILNRLDGVEVLLVSDYAKGVCTPSVLKAVIAACRDRGIAVFVDPARITDYDIYRGATLLLPNRAEAQMATGLTISTPQDASMAAKQLIQKYDVPAVLIKLDREGMVLVRSGFQEEVFPAKARSVYDVTGAGDMVLAMVGICRACDTPWPDTIRIANVSAGLEVEKHGVCPVSREEICAELLRSSQRSQDKITTLPQLLELVATHRRDGKKIVFTNGCFDLLHVGHVTNLQEAAKTGDVLIVAINSDASVRRLKGCDRPVICQADRAKILASLDCVSHVVIFDEDTPLVMLRAIRPDVLVKGGTYAPKEVIGYDLVTSYGGSVAVLSVVEGISTSRIISEVMSKNGRNP
jgi:D-beta-D-heptose 7-phosphate kinase / D-beta-D-heptose 1-phosphate adenosyltransferase